LFPDFEINSHFEIIELFVLEDVDRSSAVSFRFLEIFSTSDWVGLRDGLFVRENVFLCEFPFGRPFFHTCRVHWNIGTLVIELVFLLMRFPSLQKE
jgi:hypothetical protein